MEASSQSSRKRRTHLDGVPLIMQFFVWSRMNELSQDAIAELRSYCFGDCEEVNFFIFHLMKYYDSMKNNDNDIDERVQFFKWSRMEKLSPKAIKILQSYCFCRNKELKEFFFTLMRYYRSQMDQAKDYHAKMTQTMLEANKSTHVSSAVQTVEASAESEVTAKESKIIVKRNVKAPDVSPESQSPLAASTPLIRRAIQVTPTALADEPLTRVAWKIPKIRQKADHQTATFAGKCMHQPLASTAATVTKNPSRDSSGIGLKTGSAVSQKLPASAKLHALTQHAAASKNTAQQKLEERVQAAFRIQLDSNAEATLSKYLLALNGEIQFLNNIKEPHSPLAYFIQQEANVSAIVDEAKVELSSIDLSLVAFLCSVESNIARIKLRVNRLLATYLLTMKCPGKRQHPDVAALSLIIEHTPLKRRRIEGCAFCKAPHSSEKCHVYPTPEGRDALLKDLYLCRHCLQSRRNHPLKCSSYGKMCSHCKGHNSHVALCRWLKHPPKREFEQVKKEDNKAAFSSSPTICKVEAESDEDEQDIF